MAVIYAPIFRGQIFFARDPARWNYPARHHIASALAQHDSPWWNPRSWVGLSAAANPLYGPFYPPHLAAFFGPPEALAWVLTATTLAHLVAGALGLFALARRLGASASGAAVGALVWGLCGYTTAMWDAGLLLPAGSFVPWIALGLDHAVEDGPRPARAVVFGALPLGLSLLHGEVFITLLGLLFSAAVLLHFRAPFSTPGALRRACFAVVLGLGLGAVTLSLAQAGADMTPRARGLSRDEAELYSLHPLRAFELALPHPFGHTATPGTLASRLGEPRTDGLPLASSVYLGAAALGLAGFGLSALGRLRGASLAATLAAIWALSLGRFTPLNGLFRLAVVPLRFMRYPEKYLVVFMALVALLAALGVSQLTTWRRARSLALALGALGLASLAAAAMVRGPAHETLLRAGLATLLRGGLAGLTLYLGWRRRHVGAALALVVFFDLAFEALPHLGFLNASVPLAPPPVLSRLEALRRPSPRPLRVYRSGSVSDALGGLAFDDPGARERAFLDSLIQNNAATYGVTILPGYDAAIAPQLTALWEAAHRTQGARLLRLLGVDVALLRSREDGTIREGFRYVGQFSPGVGVYAVEAPLGPAYVASEARPEGPLMALVEGPSVEGRRVTLSDLSGASGLTATAASRCTMTEHHNAEVRLECTLDGRGVAVVTEGYDPGWSVTVDGLARPALCANRVMRGVVVEAGAHTVVWRFRPRGLEAGGALSALAWLVALALWARSLRRG